MNNTGKLYGVGVGPGDKELITVKALRVIEECDIIAVPVMKNGEKTAYKIIEDYVKGRETVEYFMPMTKDVSVLNANYNNIAESVENYLSQGKNVAFITLGDPTVYSTYMQINSLIKERGYETELIPGVTSFCAAAARLNMPLCERDEPLIVLPASYKEVEHGLKHKGTKVLMKTGREMGKVCEMIKNQGKAEKSVMVECCGMENEKIYYNIDDIAEKSSYFSIFIVKD